MKLLKDVAHKFSYIGALLDLNSGRMEEIGQSNGTAHDKLQSMLELWLKSDKATWDAILDVLESSDLNKTAVEIRLFLGSHRPPAGKPLSHDSLFSLCDFTFPAKTTRSNTVCE